MTTVLNQCEVIILTRFDEQWMCTVIKASSKVKQVLQCTVYDYRKKTKHKHQSCPANPKILTGSTRHTNGHKSFLKLVTKRGWLSAH